MTDPAAHNHLAFVAAGWLAAGALLGAVHFRTLRWSVQRLAAGRVAAPLALQLLRLALTGAALTLTVRLFGAVPLLAGLLGLVVARTGVLLLEVR